MESGEAHHERPRRAREDRLRAAGLLLGRAVVGAIVNPLMTRTRRAMNRQLSREVITDMMPQQCEASSQEAKEVTRLPIDQPKTRHKYMIDVLARGHNSPRNAGLIVRDLMPHGSDGDYSTLAFNTLNSVRTPQRQRDGSIALLGERVHAQRMEAVQAAGAIDHFAESETAYVGGVAAVLMELGYIWLTPGVGVAAQGGAEFTDGISWNQGTMSYQVGGHLDTVTTHTAQIAFNPENPLHTLLLAGESEEFAWQAVELEFSGGSMTGVGDEYLTLRLVDASAGPTQAPIQRG